MTIEAHSSFEGEGVRAERLSRVLELFSGRCVVVLGDLVADQFLYGEISRVSREAPVLILRHERTETVPGGAANCAVNLAALGARVTIVGAVGEDEPGRTLINKLHAAGVDCGGVVRQSARQTTTKVRILAGQSNSMRQQVIRVDYEGTQSSDPIFQVQISALLSDALLHADAVIISDYNYDVANAATTTLLREAATKNELPIIVDSRFRLPEFSGFTSATPNEAEVEQVLGRRLTDRAEIETAGEELRARLGYRALLITRGSQGMVLLERDAAPMHVAPVGAREAVDVTGAGDTVIAAYTLAVASGASFADAAHLANYAGGLVVMKRGTASIDRQELLASVRQAASSSS
ncbi:MAG: bifunctional hydroxymethylpyrimidine kinase/phosphomethylpyrimidine kinase [Pyrinomonadaceae bacterium]|nr:bifunctional hydroxymethylpyrimidine kinase/phosphomethylpyrimidine kinase [Pyrinomonadaceae bacterium]